MPRRRSRRTSRRSCTASARTAIGPAKSRRCRCCRTRTRGRGRRRSRPRSMAREMPPWGADMSQTLPMRNDISLSQKEIDTIAAWVDGGAAKGNAADMPPSPKFATGWTAGTEPDLDPRDAGRVRHSRRRRARRADVLFEGAVDRRQVRGDRRTEAEQPRRAASRRHFLRRHSRRRVDRQRPHRRQGRQDDRRSRIARTAVNRQRPARIEQVAVVGAGPRPRSSSRRHRQAPAGRQVHQLAAALQPDRQAGEGSHAARHLVQQGAGHARSADPPGRRSAGHDQGRIVDLSRRRPRDRIQGRPEQHAPQPQHAEHSAVRGELAASPASRR